MRAAGAAAMLPALVLLAGCVPAHSADVAHVAVDTTARFQTMTGWEATAQAGQGNARYARYRDTLIALAVGDLGLNRIRLEVRSASEHTREYFGLAAHAAYEQYRCQRYEMVNDNADPRVIDPSGFHFGELDEAVEQLVLPLSAALAARGERLFLNVTYVAFLGQCPMGTANPHRDPEEYAEFALATVLHLRQRYGLVPDTWEVILEPDNTADWRGASIGRAIVATAARFRAAGIPTRFVAPSNTSASAAVSYFDAMLRVPGVRGELAEFAYHRYRGVSPQVLADIGRRSRDGVRTSMLEHIGSGVDDLIEDLTVANVSAWSQYALAFPQERDRGGLYYRVDLADSARPRVVEGTRTRLLKLVFRHVRLGAVRLGASSDRSSVRPVAFANVDGRHVVAVRTRGAQRVRVAGLPAGRYGITWVTGSDQGMRPDTVIAAGDAVAADIPDAGVLTVFAR